ncbi:flagellar hook-length control protein FliK [Peribacillus sp. NPDC097206]|uniref:flagellar hook-length control protein FliK n=1 Tax=unclassified Peribacillus TaxID=2675266 RepID=UPI00380217F8
MNSVINSMLPLASVISKVQPNQSQGSNAQFGSALQSALTVEKEPDKALDAESITLSEEKLTTLKDLVNFLKQSSLSDLEGGVAAEDLLINDSSGSGELLLQLLQSLNGDDKTSLERFFTSIEELDLDSDQEEMALDSQCLLGANVMELYTILKQVASLSEEEWKQLPIDGTANLLKLVKVQELLSEKKDMTQDEASIQKQMKNVLEGITGKLEKWVSNEQQKKSGDLDFSVLVDKGQNKSLETVRNAFSRMVGADKEGNKHSLSLPIQILKPDQLNFTLTKNEQTGPPVLNGEESSSDFAPFNQLGKNIKNGQLATTGLNTEESANGETVFLNKLGKNIKSEQAGLTPLNKEESIHLNTSVPVQTTKVEQLVLTASKGGQTVSQEEFVKRFESILNKSNFSGTNGVNKLLIRLNPEHLGSLRIELIQKDGMMTARILATTAHAKDMLENQVQGLKQAFNGQNIQIEKIEIAQAFNSFNAEKFSQKDAEQHSRQHQESKQESNEESESEFTSSFAEALLNLEV